MRPSYTDFKKWFRFKWWNKWMHMRISTLTKQKLYNVKMAMLSCHIKWSLSLSIHSVQNMIVWLNVIHVLFWIILYHFINFLDTFLSTSKSLENKKILHWNVFKEFFRTQFIFKVIMNRPWWFLSCCIDFSWKIIYFSQNILL